MLLSDPGNYVVSWEATEIKLRARDFTLIATRGAIRTDSYRTYTVLSDSV